jgi:glutaryl-CoA dehydrogenase (non-decarboxylating)
MSESLWEESEDIRELRNLVREWGVKEIRPRFRELEEKGEFPREIYRQMGALGFFGAAFPEEHGGAGGGYRTLVAVAEELSWVYPPLSAAMNLQGATVPQTLVNWGSSEIIAEYVHGLLEGELIGSNGMTEPDGGSDFLGAMRTRAVPDGDDFVITGEKMWITNANVADMSIIYAKTDPSAGHKGVTAFVVPTSTPGFTVTRVPCRVLGSLMPTTAISLENVRVPKRNVLGEVGQGFTVAMTAMDYGRLTLAARQLGLAQASLDASLEYANVREAFGEKIGSFQMIKRSIAEMVAEVEAARALVWNAAVRTDMGLPATRDSSIAKYFSGEVASRVSQHAAEIFGGSAFSDEYPIATYFNYAKLWQTGEGSANIQRLLIADDALGWKKLDRHHGVVAAARQGKG